MYFSTIKTTEVIRNIQMLNAHISDEVRKFLTGFLERMLEQEFDLYIGRDRYKRRKPKDIRIYRNGYRVRYYLTIWSQVLKLKVPRSRNSNFKPLLFRKGGITSEPLEQMMVQMWSEGSSYRDIINIVNRIYGQRFSLAKLNSMIRSLHEYVEQYHNKPVEKTYDCIYIDGLELTIKEFPRKTFVDLKTKKAKNAVMLGVLGQRKEKNKIIREMIDYQLCQQEDSTNYIRLLDRLKRRGLTEDKFRLAVHDGHTAITKAVRTIYNKEKVVQQECLIHHMRNVINKIENRTNKDQLRNDLWKVYSAVTEKEFLKLHKQTFQKWYDLEKEAMEQFGKLNSRMFSKYQFNTETHKDIHSNNPIERYFREIRRRTKALGIFETISSADRLLFLTIENINQRRGSIPTNSNLVFTH